ncbi:MAG: DNA starvation/stationary phase protection protein [Alphaproteobacteria bacterium]|nr:DNA starvation/stationary phase protection protein [Alphaproteobacteria bacterium]
MKKNPVVVSLEQVLSDSYALYLKTQIYHWNVEGADFKSLHELFEDQYKELAEAIDTVAELIRGLDEKVKISFEGLASTTAIDDARDKINAQGMLKDLVNDQQAIIKTLDKALSVSQKAGDEVVADALIQRLTVHRKNRWMLKSCTE